MNRLKKKYPQKLPTIEWTNRWLDVFTHFDYDDLIKYEAQIIAVNIFNKVKSMQPRTLALLSLYLACENEGIKWNKEQWERIHILENAVMSNKKKRVKTMIPEFMELVKKWQSKAR